jgi:TRAP-type C4-dicarboxylate transport system permease large subunit
VETFVAVYLTVGLLLGVALFAWAAVSEVRRRGAGGAIRDGSRAFLDELWVSRRAWLSAWTFVIAAPLIAVWATVTGDFDPTGAIVLGALWLAYVWFLCWLYRARTR